MLLVFGVVAFLMSGWAIDQFPWMVGPFLAMTIGGWALGTAGIAWLAARDVAPGRVYPLIVYLLAFAVGELLVVIAFQGRLRTDVPLTWPYLAGLVATGLGAGAMVMDWARRRTALRVGPGNVPGWAVAATAVYIIFVGGLAVATFISGPDGQAARGLFFPETMGLFSVRAFSAFFLALAAAGIAVITARDVATYDELGRAGLLLIVPITVAAIVHFGLFDFVDRPGSLVYLAAYVVVGVLLLVRLAWLRRAGAVSG